MRAFLIALAGANVVLIAIEGPMSASSSSAWPDLEIASLAATTEVLHLFAQVVGKVRMGLTPWVNHSWHVPHYVSARGLATGWIPAPDGSAFDLAVTRLSGRSAPPHPGGVDHMPDAMARDGYCQEVASAGFWPGGGVSWPAFYAYAYPAPEGYAGASVRPAAARFDAGLGEFLPSYAAVRAAPDPDAALMAFLQSTYEAAPNLADWDRARLERAEGPRESPPEGV